MEVIAGFPDAREDNAGLYGITLNRDARRVFVATEDKPHLVIERDETLKNIVPHTLVIDEFGSCGRSDGKRARCLGAGA